MNGLARLLTSDRRAAVQPRPVITPDCSHCGRPAAGRVRIIAMVGLRTLCGPCEAKLAGMGYGITEERRRG